MIFLLENNIRGGFSSITGDRYVKSDDKKRCCIMMLKIYMVTRCPNPYHMMKLTLINKLN